MQTEVINMRKNFSKKLKTKWKQLQTYKTAIAYQSSQVSGIQSFCCVHILRVKYEFGCCNNRKVLKFYEHLHEKV